MIRIVFPEPSHARWVKWRKKCDDGCAALVDAHERGESPKISNLYKAPAMLAVYKADDGPFFGKCAYCETIVLDFQHGDIEHFRPKGAVSDHEGNVVTIKDADGTERAHPGYYWLAYDWRNLLLSCVICNQPTQSRASSRKIGKGTRFPVRSFRASKMGDEVKEEPLLLHPVYDDPADHLDVLDDGVMTGKTDRGWMCIDVFGLNDRENLVAGRKRCFQRTEAILALVLQADSDSQEEAKTLLADIAHVASGRGAYSSAARAAIQRKLRPGSSLGDAATVVD